MQFIIAILLIIGFIFIGFIAAPIAIPVAVVIAICYIFSYLNSKGA